MFTKAVPTVTFYNGFHIDMNDRNTLTWCTTTTPNVFLEKADKAGGTFCLGHKVFDYYEENITFVFSGSNMSHCTRFPYNISPMTGILKEKHTKVLL